MNLEGKIALVTGGSRGIGAAICDLLGARGAIVVGTATSDAGAEAISARFAEKGINGQGMKLDASLAVEVDAVVKAIAETYGPVQVLVNNAGITRDQLLMRMKEEDWDAIMNTNLKSVYLTSKACMRGMLKARNGRIINIASVVGLMGNAGQANYAAAKAGIIGFSKSLAREIGSKSVTVNVVAPGFIDTDMTKALPEDQRDMLISQVPLARLGSADDIAAAVAFLASDDSAYITGETLNVNGGMLMP